MTQFLSRIRKLVGGAILYGLAIPFLGLFGFFWAIGGLITGEFSLRRWWRSLA